MIKNRKNLIFACLLSTVILSGCASTNQPAATTPPTTTVSSPESETALKYVESSKPEDNVSFKQVADKLTYHLVIDKDGKSIGKKVYVPVPLEVRHLAARNFPVDESPDQSTPANLYMDWIDDDRFIMMEEIPEWDQPIYFDETQTKPFIFYNKKTDTAVPVPRLLPDNKTYLEYTELVASGGGYAVLKAMYAYKGEKLSYIDDSYDGAPYAYVLFNCDTGHICDYFLTDFKFSDAPTERTSILPEDRAKHKAEGIKAQDEALKEREQENAATDTSVAATNVTPAVSSQ